MDFSSKNQNFNFGEIKNNFKKQCPTLLNLIVYLVNNMRPCNNGTTYCAMLDFEKNLRYKTKLSHALKKAFGDIWRPKDHSRVDKIFSKNTFKKSAKFTKNFENQKY
jgi:hypothetical protein